MRSVIVVASLLVLTACGGGGGTTKSTTNPTTAAPPKNAPPSPSSSAGSSSPASSAAVVADGNPVNGPAFCAFLNSMQKRLAADGSAAGAVADLAVELANWIDQHPAQKPRTARDLDAVSQASCPSLRRKTVAALGGTSFSGTVG